MTLQAVDSATVVGESMECVDRCGWVSELAGRVKGGRVGGMDGWMDGREESGRAGDEYVSNRDRSTLRGVRTTVHECVHTACIRNRCARSCVCVRLSVGCVGGGRCRWEVRLRSSVVRALV